MIMAGAMSWMCLDPMRRGCLRIQFFSFQPFSLLAFSLQLFDTAGTGVLMMIWLMILSVVISSASAS